MPTEDDVDVLLGAVLSVGRGLELQTTLQRLVRAAADLVDARYAALGVLGDDGLIAQFITVGLTDDEIRAIGPYPRGKGILGELIRHPEPLRLGDIAAHPRSVGFPANHPPMTSFLGVPLRVHGNPFGNLYLTDKRGGGEFTASDQRLVEGLASAAAVAVENARLYDEARLRERWAHGNDEISRRVLAGDAPEDVLEAVAEQAMEVAGADLAALATPDDDTPLRLRVRAAAGVGAERLLGRTVPMAGSFSAETYLSGQPIVSADASVDDRATLAFFPPGTVGPLAALPLGGPGRTAGVLTVGRRRGTAPFRSVVVEALTAFAGQAAVALELAERRRDAERLAVLRDRDRIARDLHDLAIQRLYATGLSLQGVGRRLQDRPDAGTDAERVAGAVDDVDETISLIRTTIRGLKHVPGDSRRVGLRSRLIAEVEAASRTLGFPPALRLEGPIDTLVPPATADHLVAVLRETLSNAARHAHASRVGVTLTVRDDVVMTVSDDGTGVPDGAPRSGLSNLERRAVELGGTLEVENRSPGTTVRWRVPLEP
ncbi:GAF domain-containing sensor histidine kinase [Isoptericola variabilis]|uniref:Putative signal transduction histidine kinase n=1 Tax=Isoptericola variabilis (strain 225) TaxID=743718 RepID=F6FV64_ISOV2|nr:GAF domain-containing protein [Isoptericola variabilis]AEG45492.1 putative signal transduction histidine kinase [Isoptericola variabilis 225]TWH33820.1 histidine kinase/DNA gyrase B/HSP90-like ATPase [Isoptericola variabilis J7]